MLCTAGGRYRWAAKILRCLFCHLINKVIIWIFKLSHSYIKFSHEMLNLFCCNESCTFFLSILLLFLFLLSLSWQISYVKNQPFVCERLEKEIWLLKLKKKLSLCPKKNLISLEMERIVPEYRVYESSGKFLAEFQVVKRCVTLSANISFVL